mmetsp:Transcript_8635/g.30636  ORF Transcript_8635/g.30636 Transcript_8635/m.30636 type:complete len:599 (+) Transcript_8635:1921-3717(+)
MDVADHGWHDAEAAAHVDAGCAARERVEEALACDGHLGATSDGAVGRPHIHDAHECVIGESDRAVGVVDAVVGQRDIDVSRLAGARRDARHRRRRRDNGGHIRKAKAAGRLARRVARPREVRTRQNNGRAARLRAVRRLDLQQLGNLQQLHDGTVVAVVLVVVGHLHAPAARLEGGEIALQLRRRDAHRADNDIRRARLGDAAQRAEAALQRVRVDKVGADDGEQERGQLRHVVRRDAVDDRAEDVQELHAVVRPVLAIARNLDRRRADTARRRHHRQLVVGQHRGWHDVVDEAGGAIEADDEERKVLIAVETAKEARTTDRQRLAALRAARQREHAAHGHSGLEPEDETRLREIDAVGRDLDDNVAGGVGRCYARHLVDVNECGGHNGDAEPARKRLRVLETCALDGDVRAARGGAKGRLKRGQAQLGVVGEQDAIRRPLIPVVADLDRNDGLLLRGRHALDRRRGNVASLGLDVAEAAHEVRRVDEVAADNGDDRATHLRSEHGSDVVHERGQHITELNAVLRPVLAVGRHLDNDGAGLVRSDCGRLAHQRRVILHHRSHRRRVLAKAAQHLAARKVAARKPHRHRARHRAGCWPQ